MAKDRELSDDAIRHQADALETYVSKGGSAELWLESKGFAPADLAALEHELARRAQARTA